MIKGFRFLNKGINILKFSFLRPTEWIYQSKVVIELNSTI